MKTKNNKILFVLGLILSPAFLLGQGVIISSGAYVIANSGYIIVTGNVANSGNLNPQTGIFTISGNYTNSGTYTQGTAYMTFNGSNQVLNDNGSGTMFTNVFFNGNGGSGNPAVISSGNFSVSSAGILNMVNATSLNANGYLTLNSDATGSASVSAIPLGASITGNVNVQRFIAGGAGHRGYRLLSSPVYAGTDAYSNKIYSINYLINSTFLTGTNGVAGGFDKTGNPTLYLYRENMTNPINSSFAGSNFRGIKDISASPNYTIDIDGGPFNIPIGNGYFFFFRGSRATTGQWLITTAPIATTLTASNTLNQGTINVKEWFTPTASTLSYTALNPTGAKGFSLLGNPYACTINFEKFNRNGSNSSIYGSGFTTPAIIYFFNPITKQYCSYQQKTTISSAADTTTTVNPGISSDGYATNMIASGQGFFIQTTSVGQTFSFRETAKTTSQATTASLNQLMGMPKDFAVQYQQPETRFRLRLIKDSLNTDEVVLVFNSQDSTHYSVDKDALDIGGDGAQESLSLLSSDSVQLCIHRRPFPNKIGQYVPLLVDATATGTYQLKKIQLDMPPLYELWLKDALLKDSLDLIANATYSFNIDKNEPASFGAKRFSLVIRQNSALVYRLLNFTANKVTSIANREVQLTWITEHEENYTNFTVERSTDSGKNFDALTAIQGSALGTYHLLDKAPVNGLNLYRLKQEDINNIVTYSQTIPVRFNGGDNTTASNGISVFPNPATSNITVRVPAGASANSTYAFRITNNLGALVKEGNSTQPNWQTNVSELLPGIYIINVLNRVNNAIIGNAKFSKL
ncbi:MAG TPA: T9SS type A sorting domain-containing protein [Mucilaginibacter sp.]|jgi:hypothetical protein